LDNITSIVKRKKAVLNKQNRMQAEVPATAKVIANPNGTAPGLWMEEQHKVLIAMPGVPVEMYSMVRDAVIPMIKKHFDLPFIIHKKVLVQGAFEAQLAELLEQFEDQLPDDIKLAYLPSPKQITLRLSATGINKFALEKHVDKQIQILKATIPQNIFGYDDDTLESIIGQMLTSHHKTISTAESCTGGSIAALITSVPGCSAYFKGSVVAYANEIKKQMLGVQEQTLIDHGAVSKQVVEEMVAGIKKLYNTDYAIAVSGIAGPTGGTQEKPVGTTWIAVAGQRNIISNHYLLGNNRDKNIQKTTNRALNDLRKLLISDLCK
jgi:nicotinamide-nucleotide amidase